MIALISDTHGQVDPVLRDLKKRKVDQVLHLGDYTRDQAVLAQAGYRVLGVRGNNDFDQTPWERVLDLGGKRILLTHGHREGVSYGLGGLLARAQDLGVDWVFFGHTHRYVLGEMDGIGFVNPGSPSRPRDGVRSYVLWEPGTENFQRRILA